jgi:hypothetical protein
MSSGPEDVAVGDTRVAQGARLRLGLGLEYVLEARMVPLGESQAFLSLSLALARGSTPKLTKLAACSRDEPWPKDGPATMTLCDGGVDTLEDPGGIGRDVAAVLHPRARLAVADAE